MVKIKDIHRLHCPFMKDVDNINFLYRNAVMPKEGWSKQVKIDRFQSKSSNATLMQITGRLIFL